MKSLRSLFHTLAGLAAASVLCCWQGCESTPRAGGSSAKTSSGTSAPLDLPAELANAEQKFVVGPAAARELNYRVAWQFVGGGTGMRKLVVEGDSVFVLDKRNVLTRVKADSGDRLWSIEVGNPVDLVLDIDLIDNKVYVTTDSTMLVLEGATGSQIGKQRFEKLANTASVRFNQYLIYGSRNGQIIWHVYPIGQPLRAYQVSRSIQVEPVVSKNALIAVGNDGNVMVLNAATGTQMWGKKLLAPVTCSPAAGDDAVYFAGTDQYLYAFDLTTGRGLWKVLTESPLTDAPTLIGDRVYQQIPGQGLSCFAAEPLDSPGGETKWRTPEIKGNVVAERRDQAFAWDAAAKSLVVLDVARGSVIKTVATPKAKHFVAAGDQNNDFYFGSEDGSVVKLVPRN